MFDVNVHPLAANCPPSMTMTLLTDPPAPPVNVVPAAASHPVPPTTIWFVYPFDGYPKYMVSPAANVRVPLSVRVNVLPISTATLGPTAAVAPAAIVKAPLNTY